MGNLHSGRSRCICRNDEIVVALCRRPWALLRPSSAHWFLPLLIRFWVHNVLRRCPWFEKLKIVLGLMKIKNKVKTNLPQKRHRPIFAQQSIWENDRRAWASCWVNLAVAGLLGLCRVALLELELEWRMDVDGCFFYTKKFHWVRVFVKFYRFPICRIQCLLL